MVSKLLGINKINKHNRIVIPHEVMDRMQLSKGDYLAFLLDGGRSIVLRKVDASKLSISHFG